MDNAWDIYEVTTENTPIHGVKFRGTVRKFSIAENIPMLIENASDKDNCVRFALVDNKHLETLEAYIKGFVNDAVITLVSESIANPVLSKLKVNILDRY